MQLCTPLMFFIFHKTFRSVMLEIVFLKNPVSFKGQVSTLFRWKAKSAEHSECHRTLIEQRCDFWCSYSCVLFLSYCGRKLGNVQHRHLGFDWWGDHGDSKKNYMIKRQFRDTWVAQWLSVCLWFRS